VQHVKSRLIESRPRGPKYHLPQHGTAFKSDMLGDAFLREELEQVGQNYVDFNVPNIPRAGNGGHLPELIGCSIAARFPP